MSETIDVEAVVEGEPIRKRRAFVKGEFDQILAEAKTVADILRRIDRDFFSVNKRLESVLAELPPDERAEFQAVLDKHEEYTRRRMYPWPDWVLRIAVELFSVQFPSISKARIEETFQCVHSFVFEFPLQQAIRPPIKFPDIDARILGSLMGHTVARVEAGQRELSNILAKKDVSPEVRAEYLAKISSMSEMSEMSTPLADCVKAYPGFLVQFSEALVNAKSKTFDKEGRLKETSLTPIYQAIFDDWPAIEEMSGPTELCEHLQPLLLGGENDPDKRLDRVKKICRRMGIVFKGSVKGQTPPPTLSLPPNS